MRVSRLRKHKSNNKRIFRTIKLLTFTYMLLLLSTYSIGVTNGLSIDQKNSKVTFKAKWTESNPPQNNEEWDKSSLSFSGQGGNCNGIYAVVKNEKKSRSMEEPLKYEIYFSDKGDPKNGKSLFSGISPPLNSGESVKLSSNIFLNDGVYIFKAYQSSNHPGKGEFWSKAISISGCKKPTNGQQDNTNQSSTIEEKEEHAEINVNSSSEVIESN